MGRRGPAVGGTSKRLAACALLMAAGINGLLVAVNLSISASKVAVLRDATTSSVATAALKSGEYSYASASPPVAQDAAFRHGAAPTVHLGLTVGLPTTTRFAAESTA